MEEVEVERSRTVTQTKKEKKLANKIMRKEGRVKGIVEKETGVKIQNEPSHWVLIWGLGLGLGNGRNSIAQLFQSPPDEIRLLFDKPFSFAKFNQLAHSLDAQRKYDNENNEIKTSIYFITDEPPEEDSLLLKPFKTPWPKGLDLLQNFITEEEEQKMIHFLIDVKDKAADVGKPLKHRWVQHYGYEFRYGSNDVDPENPIKNQIPSIFQPLIAKLVEQNICPRVPDQLTVNYYSKGHGIPPHVDTHSPFDDPVISLSLGSNCVMDFRNGEFHHVGINLPRRSLLVLNENARYEWTHGIANRTFDIVEDLESGGATAQERNLRISLTFRLLRAERICKCSFPQLCDSQKGKISTENAGKLESELVHNVYEKIASHFSTTRHTAWPKVQSFIEGISPFSTLLDIGCGNGKYLHLNKSLFKIGSDMSSGLLDICRTSQYEVLRSNALNLPFKDSIFDSLICIAVLHHLSTEDRRIEALKEMYRVLRVGGEGLIYVWAKNQKESSADSTFSTHKKEGLEFDSAPPPDFSFIPIHERGDFKENDLLVPWLKSDKKGGKQLHYRYYHLFQRGEMENLINKLIPTPLIISSYYFEGNYCIWFKKC